MLKRLLTATWLCWFSTGQLRAVDEISAEAKAYLNAALTTIQQNFLHKDQVEWPQFKNEVLAHAVGAQTTVDTYRAIRFALAKLGDHHSYLQLTSELAREEAVRVAGSTPAAAGPAPYKLPSVFQMRRLEGAIVPGKVAIAQLVIPSFSGPDPDGFATRLQGVVAELALTNPCGWIADLRGNGGGNMWPMLAGIGPVLGEGEPGYFLNASSKLKWYYESGKAGVRGNPETFAKTATAPVQLKEAPPVAVLIDRGTGSSGEAIAVAFRGRLHTRFFGENTFGAASATSPFKLSDGAQIYLVVATNLDRDGNEYPDGIKPDQEILSDATISWNDPVLRVASEWLSTQEACLEQHAR